MKPCAGLKVVEIAFGVSDLGLGLAGSVPGLVLADLGATVTRVVDRPAEIDADLSWSYAWHRGKVVASPGQALQLLRDADIALVYGPHELIEAAGLGYDFVQDVNPRVVYGRCAPSRTQAGVAPDHGLLVEARAGFCTQLEGHRPGPIFVDVRASGVGAASLLLVSVLSLLFRRERTGVAGFAETSLYDGLLATLGCMIGRSERAAPEIESYWEKGSTFPNFLYRCSDGELIQVWFGGKGMYGALIEVLGDTPSQEGYYHDQMTGKLGERARRWVSMFARRPRAEWVRVLREAKVACEPVLAPGEVLYESHSAEIGLAVRHGRDVVVGSPIQVFPPTSIRDDETPRPPSPPARPLAARDHATGGGGPLARVRVVDFSAFVAGPLAAEVLADLGADVVKIEPPEGEAMRAAAYAVAACQRGKRSLALNINAPSARPVLDELVRGADVVLHNWRVGVAERLGLGAADVARINPDAVYCHASAFGVTGPRAKLPGNDALMQAVTGFERGIGGVGNDPIAATWIPIDMCGGWVAAAGVLAGLVARARGLGAPSVATSLLGAGTLLHSGAFIRDGELVEGPELDRQQTGYGPGYRIYQAGDGEWFALVIPSAAEWVALGQFAELPETYAPVRGGKLDDAARAAEAVLEQAFRGATAAEWVERLRGLGLPVELIVPTTRDEFRAGVLDDPVNRELGRAITYETADWGRFEQIGPLLRVGPDPGDGPRFMLPGVGEHTVEVLAELGFSTSRIEGWLAEKVAHAQQ